MTNEQNFFDQPLKNLRAYNNIRINTTDQVDDYTAGCLVIKVEI